MFLAAGSRASACARASGCGVRTGTSSYSIEDAVRASTDHLGCAELAELLDQRTAAALASRQRCEVSSERIASILLVASSRDPLLDRRRGSRAPRRSAGRPGRGCPSRRPWSGTYGQTSPQPIVTAQSACSCISTVSRFGLRPERSIPTSRITSTTSGHSWRAGSDPADSPRQSPGHDSLEQRLGHLRAPGVVGAYEQHVLHPCLLSLRGRDQLLGVLAGQSGGGDLARDRLGVVGHALDRRAHGSLFVELRGSRTRRAGRRPWACRPSRS